MRESLIAGRAARSRGSPTYPPALILGHAFYESTVRFEGGPEAGWRALAVCLAYGFSVRRLERYWAIQQDHGPTGPARSLVFREQLP
jgi:hypothetical protein